MSAELEKLVTGLLSICLNVAGDVPRCCEPLSAQGESAADTYFRAIAVGEPMPLQTKMVASALIPRLLYGRAFGGVIESALLAQARLDGVQISDAEILEQIFLKMWKDHGHQLWREGALGGGSPVT